MTRRRLSACAIAALVLLAPQSGGEDAHWTYEGAHGPEHWGDLMPEYATCAIGQQQSPIDLTAAVAADVVPPALAWRVADAEVVNNGHTIQVSLSEAGGLNYGGKPFALAQFHVHHPSEHTIDGRSYPLEIHFVHVADDGALAVIGVMFEEGAADPTLNTLWDAASPVAAPPTPIGPIDPRLLLPTDETAFHYAGSLTTPPCSELVTWTVLATPMQASAEQIAAFAAVFPNNARPPQERHRRFVLATE